MTVDDEERILEAAAGGVSIRALAAEHGLSQEAVTAVLDRAAEAWFTGATAAGALFVKVAERKATLIGLNAPSASASVVIHQSVSATQVTSTERIRQALDRLRLRKPEDANGEAPP